MTAFPRMVMIDMNLGNLGSVRRAFERLGVTLVQSQDASDILSADFLILPGVGAFGDGMKNLHELGLVEAIYEKVRIRNTPLLGICVGMQVLASSGNEHGQHEGLSLIPGRCVQLKALERSPEYRVPHMGWADVHFFAHSQVRCTLQKNGHAQEELCFYFANSYHFIPEDWQMCSATFDFGTPCVAMLEHKNIFGIQFHPEKSQAAGMLVLESILDITEMRKI